MGERRLLYRVIECSSEELDHPCSELAYQSRDSHGWLSQRLHNYPQNIIIQLTQPSQVTTIAILSH